MKCTTTLLVFLFGIVALSAAHKADYETKLFGVRELVQVRCSLDSEEVFMFFNGSIFAYPNGERNVSFFTTHNGHVPSNRFLG